MTDGMGGAKAKKKRPSRKAGDIRRPSAEAECGTVAAPEIPFVFIRDMRLPLATMMTYLDRGYMAARTSAFATSVDLNEYEVECAMLLIRRGIKMMAKATGCGYQIAGFSSCARAVNELESETRRARQHRRNATEH